MTLKDLEYRLIDLANSPFGPSWASPALHLLQTMRQEDRKNRTIRPPRRTTSSRMTPELARKILHLYNTTDMNQREIAEHYNVNHGRVNEVVKRGKHLEE